MLTQQRLQQVLHFDSATGVFTWKVSNTNRIKVGDIAGCVRPDGYRLIWLDGRLHFAHRLAWLYATGGLPTGEIDHIDGDPANNAITNLRDVPRVVNRENQRRASRSGKAGMLGVSGHREKFSARIGVRGKTKYLGTFDTAEAAHDAYVAAKRVLHEGCSL